MPVDRPIIFSAPMVRALLAGTKTQTRRMLKPQPQRFEVAPDEPCEMTLMHVEGDPWPRVALGRVITRQEVRYRPGMRLWVRENCWTESRMDDGDGVRYPADGEWRVIENTPAASEGWGKLNCYASMRHPDNDTNCGLLVPSIHMPRWASRLTLTVTDVRVQRLQEIGRGDAMEEGCPHPNMATGPDPRDWYRDLWDQLHGAGEWDKNPEIVAISFTVERRNIDAR